MHDALTYSAEDLKIERGKVSANVWNMLLALSGDPDGYAAADHFYIDAEADIDFELNDDGGVWWDATSFTIDGVTFSTGEVYCALCDALNRQQSAHVEEACESASGVSYHHSSEWNGSWRAA